ncbi:MAG TPA: hypothetical protein VMJ31_01265 [Methylocystis sp.]|nr:hypothetical protein [Methylocystis sp.]
MRRLIFTLLPVLALAPQPTQAAPNVPLCLAIQKNFVDCKERQERRNRHWEWERHREYEDYGDWGGPSEYEGPPDEGCGALLVALKQNQCF